MPTITRTILGILSQKTARQLDGSEAVIRLLAELRKQVAAELVAIPAESYAALNLRATMRSIEGHLSTWQSTAGREVTTALSDVWNQGADFVPTISAAAGVYSGIGHISTTMLDTLTEFTTHKFDNLAHDLNSKINAEVSLGILGQKTPGQIADAILGGGLEGTAFTTAQQRATTIVQTELGRAFSMATNLGIEKAQEVLPEMEKMWIHAGRPKQARLTHVIAHGQHVPANEKFLIGSIAMKYPRDPAGGAANSIHCGCDMVPYMPDWYTPDEFIADWEKQQDKVNNRKKEATHG